MTPLVATFAKIGPTYEAVPETVYYWSGSGVIQINIGDGLQRYTGTTVNGTQLASIASIRDNQGTSNRRATITLVLPNQESVNASLVDPGPVKVKLNWAMSTNQGQTWSVLDVSFVGRVSATTTTQNTVVYQIDTLVDSDRYGTQRDISFEGQRAKYPAITEGPNKRPEDDSFFMLPIIGSQGIRTRWPRDT